MVSAIERSFQFIFKKPLDPRLKAGATKKPSVFSFKKPGLPFVARISA